MLCQKCHKRIANVHFTRVVNNQKVEMYLCEQCANEQGQTGFDAPLSVSEFLSGIFNFGNSAPYVNLSSADTVCDKCGMSFQEFQKSGKLGCSNCYRTFGERLKSILKRLHGSAQHSGRIPEKVSESIKLSREIEKLKEMLNEAVKNEEYEKAAELRDKIRSLEVK